MIALLATLALAAPFAPPSADGPPARWEIGVPLPLAAEADGAVPIPPGKAVLLVVNPPEAAVHVRLAPPLPAAGGAAPTDDEDDGAVDRLRLGTVDVLGQADGLLVPAAGTSRRVFIDTDAGAKVTVHYSEGVRPSAWEAWEAEATEALVDNAPVPLPPGGSRALAAEVELRGAAVADPAVARLGLRMDIERVRPLGATTHAIGEELPLSAGQPLAVSGPGVVLLRVAPPAGLLQRYTLRVELDGLDVSATALASTGAAPLTVRVWVPPGDHTLTAAAPELPSLRMTAQAAPLRPSVLGRLPVPEAPTGVAAAELAWIQGDRAAALTGFRAELDAAGPAGELARARVLALTEDPEEAARLAASTTAISLAGAELLANATLVAAPLLPDAVVLDAARRASDPDLDALAIWLDGGAQVRPRGAALLELASPDVPVSSPSALRAVRRKALATRLTNLMPTAPSSPGEVRWSATGPGVPRQILVAGETATVTLPPVSLGRVPVLRIYALEPAAFTVDGAPWAANGPGGLDVGLLPGEHTLVATKGRLRIPDADLVSGGTRVFEWTSWATPATWPLLDPGVSTELALSTEGSGRWTARFDDGRIERFETTEATSEVRLTAGPNARTLTLEGPPDARATVAMRVVTNTPEIPPLSPLTDPAALVAEVERLSRAIDAGEPGARAARALLLLQVGQLSRARQDLAQLVATNDLVAVAELRRRLAEQVPTSAAAGPRSLAAALAAASYDGTPPTGAPELEALAASLGQPWLSMEAAYVRLTEGNGAAALADARAAGPLGEELTLTIEGRLAWQGITFANRSAGLVSAPRERRDAPGGPLWRLLRDALFAPPWPSGEALVLRGDTVQVAEFKGRSWSVDVFCRDETRAGLPCTVPTLENGAPGQLVIGDGEVTRIRGSGPFRAHRLEIGPAAPDTALAARLVVDGELRPPQTIVRGLRATKAMPIALTVSGPTVLRVEALVGEARIGDVVLRVGDPPALIPLVDVGPRPVEIVGDAVVVVAVGALAAPVVEAPSVQEPAPPPPPPRVDFATVRPILARATADVPLPDAPPRDSGTWSAEFGAYHTNLQAPREPWNAIEAEGGWSRVGPVGWAAAAAWMRGPAIAGGVEAEYGRTWPNGWVGLRGRGGVGTGVVGAAGSVGLDARARQELHLDPVNTLRLEVRGAAGFWSEGAPTPVDPRAWTYWSSDHPIWLSLEGGWAGALFRDLRVDAGVRATSNTGFSLDSVGGDLGADLLVKRALVLSADASVKWRFADGDRAQAGLWSDVRLGADWSVWSAVEQRYTLWAEAGLVQGAPIGAIGVRYMDTGGRGLRDLPPGREPFRTARGPR